MSTPEAVLRQAEETIAPDERRLLPRLARDRTALLGLTVIALFVLGAFCAPWLAGHDPNQTDFLNRFAPRSWDHPLGTDHVGRDGSLASSTEGVCPWAWH